MYALRAALVLGLVVIGYLFGLWTGDATKGMAAGLALGVAANLAEIGLSRAKANAIVGAMTGLAAGVFTAWLLMLPFALYIDPDRAGLIDLALAVVLGYGGMLAGFQRGSVITVATISKIVRGHADVENIKLLDTSVIIDGRIADICETDFIEGIFVVPQFILMELQHIADSPDSLKRARGRRGLDILQRIQKIPNITVRIVEDDFPKIKEVDSKLVALAKNMGAKVITNDFNLNKVAELQGVKVLNINQLANAIKPLVLPGEPLRVFVVKEGKEHNQGVAYLEDGTMVVVDNGRKYIGNNMDVTVTSVLQTTAGRMIFTKTREEYERDETKNSR